MTDEIKQKLTHGIVRLLRPLVRILLRYGFSFGEFAELARWIFVDVAGREFGIKGRKQTISRISIITGLNRKDVTRLKQVSIKDDYQASSGRNRAVRVISAWVRDPGYHDAEGRPADLPLEGEAQSFAALVKQYSGDMPVRAVLDELLRVEAARKNADNTVTLLTKAYIPKNVDAEKISILGSDAADLISTIDHNLDARKEQAYFQRKVMYDNIPVEAVAGFKAASSSEGQNLLEKLDSILAVHDRDCNPDATGTGRRRIGVGIYYFEEDLDEAEKRKDTDEEG